MLVTRRALLSGLLAGAGGLLVPVPAALVLPERRIWALGRWAEPDPLALVMESPGWPALEAALVEVIERKARQREYAAALHQVIRLGLFESDEWRIVEAVD